MINTWDNWDSDGQSENLPSADPNNELLQPVINSSSLEDWPKFGEVFHLDEAYWFRLDKRN